MAGPRVLTDIVDVHVFRRRAGVSGGVEFLQLHRAAGALADTWQPVMGHVEAGETAVAAAVRELQEETGFALGGGLLGFWQLEVVNTYYLARLDAVVMSPGFAAEVAPDAQPVPDDAHDAARWVRRDMVDRAYMWPGHRAAVEHIVRDIVPADSPVAAVLRIDLIGR